MIYKHWHLAFDDKRILWLGLDRNDADVNSINEAVLKELKHILDDLHDKYDLNHKLKNNAEIVDNRVDNLNAQNIAGLVIYSMKKKGFIAGADVHEFSQFTVKQAAAFVLLGQTVFDQLASLSIPTVAMIHGFCLGGGGELALACRYRVLAENSGSVIGFPEVLIGIMPAWGGMSRLPPVVGSFYALTRLLLTGKSISEKEALKQGLADAVVPVRDLRMAAVDFVLSDKVSRKTPRFSFKESVFEFSFTRKIAAYFIRRQLNQRISSDLYPAPYAILDYWTHQSVIARSAATGQSSKITIDIIKKLMEPNGRARKLIHAFNLRELLKKQGTSQNADTVKLYDDKTRPVKHVHIVGAGIMGGDIAMWCVFQGLTVTIQDANIAAIGKIIAKANNYFEKQYKKQCGKSSGGYSFEVTRLVRSALNRLIPDAQGYGIANADVIIEAIIENIAVKKALFKTIEKHAKPHAILATNTSSLSIHAISEALKKPERLVGIHFFNPATKMELVEVVTTEKISKILSQTLAFIIQIGKLPVLVKDSPGFLVNRILMPYLMEALKLLDEGVDPNEIDEAAVAKGFMMGPIELADTVGLDICLSVARNLYSSLKSLSGQIVSVKLEEKVKHGSLGKKTGSGLYSYDKQGRKKMSWTLKSFLKKDLKNERIQIGNRLASKLMKEAKICLQEGVVENKDLLEAVMIFGMGFLSKEKMSL